MVQAILPNARSTPVSRSEEPARCYVRPLVTVRRATILLLCAGHPPARVGAPAPALRRRLAVGRSSTACSARSRPSRARSARRRAPSGSSRRRSRATTARIDALQRRSELARRGRPEADLEPGAPARGHAGRPARRARAARPPAGAAEGRPRGPGHPAARALHGRAARRRHRRPGGQGLRRAARARRVPAPRLRPGPARSSPPCATRRPRRPPPRRGSRRSQQRQLALTQRIQARRDEVAQVKDAGRPRPRGEAVRARLGARPAPATSRTRSARCGPSRRRSPGSCAARRPRRGCPRARSAAARAASSGRSTARSRRRSASRRAWEACHPGIDIGVPAGTPIRAAGVGRVVLMQPESASGGYGNFTCVQHTASMSTCYAHQSRFATSMGASVRAGAGHRLRGCTGPLLRRPPALRGAHQRRRSSTRWATCSAAGPRAGGPCAPAGAAILQGRCSPRSTSSASRSRPSASCSRSASWPPGRSSPALQELGKPADWAYEMVFAALAGGLIGARAVLARPALDEVATTSSAASSAAPGSSGTAARSAARSRVLAWAWWRGSSASCLLDVCARRRWRWATPSGGSAASSPATATTARPRTCPWAMAYPHGTVPTTRTVHPTPVYETHAMGLVAWGLWRLRDRFRPGCCSRSTSWRRASSASSSSSCAATTDVVAGLTAPAAREPRADAGRRRVAARRRPPRRAQAAAGSAGRDPPAQACGGVRVGVAATPPARGRARRASARAAGARRSTATSRPG